MALSTITVADVLTYSPCSPYDEEYLSLLSGGQADWNALEIIAVTSVPWSHRIWLVLRTDLIPEADLHTLSVDFADHVKDYFAQKFPLDSSISNAISAKDDWNNSLINDATLASYREAADDSAEQSILTAEALPGAGPEFLDEIQGIIAAAQAVSVEAGWAATKQYAEAIADAMRALDYSAATDAALAGACAADDDARDAAFFSALMAYFAAEAKGVEDAEETYQAGLITTILTP